jgi:hypothetical protein
MEVKAARATLRRGWLCYDEALVLQVGKALPHQRAPTYRLRVAALLSLGLKSAVVRGRLLDSG